MFLEDIKKANDPTINKFLEVFGEEYSRIRIFKELKAAIEKCCEIYPVKQAVEMLNNREFLLEVLMERPNQQITMRIFMLVSKDYERVV